jgi:hypothetical protein
VRASNGVDDQAADMAGRLVNDAELGFADQLAR